MLYFEKKLLQLVTYRVVRATSSSISLEHLDKRAMIGSEAA